MNNSQGPGDYTSKADLLLPTFVIEYCIDCSTHQWNTRHDANKYETFATDLTNQIKLTIPNLINPEIQILKGLINIQLRDSQTCQVSTSIQKQYNPTDHMRFMKFTENGKLYKKIKPQLGAFEVYFMGVRLFSKLISKEWPFIPSVVEKCAFAYQLYSDQNPSSSKWPMCSDISQLECFKKQTQLSMSESVYKQRLNTNQSQGLIEEHPEEEEHIMKEKGLYLVKGRLITMEECEFVFDKVWKSVPNNQHHAEAADHGEEPVHHIMLNDLYQIVYRSAVLLHKKMPDEKDHKPFEEFMKFAEAINVTDQEGKNSTEVRIVHENDVPLMLLHIFIGQEDDMESHQHLFTNAQEVFDEDTTEVVHHVIDEIWEQFPDITHDNFLPKEDCYNFVGMVIDILETHLAEQSGRKPREITLEEIKEVAYDIDKNHDGKISKEELYEWLGKYWNSNEQLQLEFKKSYTKKSEKL